MPIKVYPKKVALPPLFMLKYALVPFAAHWITCCSQHEQQVWRVVRVFGLRVALWATE